MPQSVAQQIDTVMNLGTGRGGGHITMRTFRTAAGMATAVLAALCIWHGFTFWWSMALVVAGVVFTTSIGPMRHMERAAKGLQHGTSRTTQVSLRTEHWTDSATYHATVRGQDGRLWDIPFRTSTASLQDGVYEAEAFDLPDCPWPVILIMNDIVLWPTHKPAQVKPPS